MSNRTFCLRFLTVLSWQQPLFAWPRCCLEMLPNEGLRKLAFSAFHDTQSLQPCVINAFPYHLALRSVSSCSSIRQWFLPSGFVLLSASASLVPLGPKFKVCRRTRLDARIKDRANRNYVIRWPFSQQITTDHAPYPASVVSFCRGASFLMKQQPVGGRRVVACLELPFQFFYWVTFTGFV